MSLTHLHVHSVYSKYDGISTVQELVDQAVEHGHNALAITNHGLDSMGDLFAFQQYAKKKGIKPILGNESYLVEELITMSGKKRVRTKNNHIILLAANEAGWKNLCKLSYISNVDEEHFYYKPRITFEELFEHKEGLVVGSACLASVFSQHLLNNNETKAEEYFKRFVDELGENFYAEIQLNELVQEQKKYNDWIIKTAEKYNVPVVLTGDVHYATPDGANTQRFVFNLRKEEDSEGDDTYKCKSLFYQGIDDFKNFNKIWNYGYTDEQIDNWCSNSNKIAEKCNFTIPLGNGMKLPRFSFDEEDDFVRLSKEGLANHFNCNYEDCPKEYKERLEYELEMLLRKGAFRYMLQLSSVVKWAREQKYMIGPGRGSAAGSLVCACLGITSWAIDPLKFGLLFERFVSEDRLISVKYDYFNEKR
jgi:DNA polymerase-3 subunit alpha